jgi:hypothetical protein
MGGNNGSSLELRRLESTPLADASSGIRENSYNRSLDHSPPPCGPHTQGCQPPRFEGMGGQRRWAELSLTQMGLKALLRVDRLRSPAPSPLG